VLFTDATPSGCGMASSQTGPFYCPPDRKVYLDLDFFRELQQRFHARGGDFAVAYVVAHEYGHNVQAELGIKPTQPTVSQFELEADCLAGAFANSEYYASALDPGDVARAISTAELVGDYSFTDASHHGTPAERVAAWKLGYNSGSPQKCIDSFTP
jgi:hypothetical protein